MTELANFELGRNYFLHVSCSTDRLTTPRPHALQIYLVIQFCPTLIRLFIKAWLKMDISVPLWQNGAGDQTGDIIGFRGACAIHSSSVRVCLCTWTCRSERVFQNVWISMSKCMSGHLRIEFSAVTPFSLIINWELTQTEWSNKWSTFSTLLKLYYTFNGVNNRQPWQHRKTTLQRVLLKGLMSSFQN